MNDKPIPRPTAETRPFWEACARDELIYQCCGQCGRPQFYPRSLCAHCQGVELSWERSAGRGSVHSFTTVHRAPSAPFRADVPYVLALIDMDEGFRMMTNIVGCAPEEVHIGTRIKIVFEPRGSGDAKIPQSAIERPCLP